MSEIDRDPPPGPDPAPGDPLEGEPEEPDSTGTLFIMMVFLMAMAALWLIMYFLLLDR
jgi:hypothetical protein